MRTIIACYGAAFLVALIIVGGSSLMLNGAFAASVTSQVLVGNSAPAISAVTLNGGSAITLTPNATTTVNVSFTVTDNNGCSDVFTGGGITSTLYRSGLGSSCTANNLNCYILTTTTNNCSSGASAQATATYQIYYFAQATDASSSFSAENWNALIVARDASGATSSLATASSSKELNTLTAINVTTSSLNYGTVPANTDTGSTNQTATTTNAGNSSTTLQLSGTALTSGANVIATSSQVYSTSTFTYPGTSTAISATPVTVGGFTLTSPTSTTNVAQATFWGLAVPNGTPTGTYTGTNTFSSLFIP